MIKLEFGHLKKQFKYKNQSEKDKDKSNKVGSVLIEPNAPSQLPLQWPPLLWQHLQLPSCIFHTNFEPQ